MTTTSRLPATETRRLLNARQLADKLGIGITRLKRSHLRAVLEEKEGLPPPFMGGKGGTQQLLWDSYAIDLWLDSKLPAGLQARAAEARTITDAAAVNARLASRAQELNI